MSHFLFSPADQSAIRTRFSKDKKKTENIEKQRLVQQLQKRGKEKHIMFHIRNYILHLIFFRDK